MKRLHATHFIVIDRYLENNFRHVGWIHVKKPETAFKLQFTQGTQLVDLKLLILIYDKKSRSRIRHCF